MAGTYMLHIVSPEGIVLKEEVEFAVFPGEVGELGVLPNHAPLIAALDIGVVRYTKDGSTKRIAISGGFLEVSDNKASILAESAERGEVIDLERAMAARKRAEERLAKKNAETDVKRAEQALRKAIARIRAAQDEKR